MGSKLTVLSQFDKNHPGFVNRTRFLHLHGGLGDIFNHLFLVPCYRRLDSMALEERAFALLSTHNSMTFELFAWHPRASQITIADIGVQTFLHQNTPEAIQKRSDLGIPKDCDHEWPLPESIRFYPSPTDGPPLRAATSRGRYVVFALTASDHGRSIPETIGRTAAELFLWAGYRVIVTGRNYSFNDHGDKKVRRTEIRLKDLPVDDYVDRLTVPGTAELVRGASAVFTCHSAVCMLAWHLRVPTMVLYDEFAKTAYFTKKYEGYSFGAAFPGNAHAPIKSYDAEMTKRFIEELPKE